MTEYSYTLAPGPAGTITSAAPAPPDCFTFHNSTTGQVASINQDGVFTVTVDPTDKNAQLFIEVVNSCLHSAVGFTGMQTTEQSKLRAQAEEWKGRADDCGKLARMILGEG